MRLELRLAVLVVSEILEQLIDGFRERLVLWILIELLSDEFELLYNPVGVILVALAEEESALVVEPVAFFGGGVLNDIALLLQAAADILVEIFEPLLELWVALGILVNLIERVCQIVKGGAVGKALKQFLCIRQQWPTTF